MPARGRGGRSGASATAGRRLHEGLIGERALVGSRYLADPALRDAYQADLAPRTGAALARVLAEVAPDRSGVRRALDLGAGTGAAGRAVRAHFGDGVELVSVDRVRAPGIVAADLARPVRPPGVEGRFDLVVAAHLLNELAGTLDVGARAALVAWWFAELVSEGGSCVLLEPALRETSRELLAVRDRLLAGERFAVVAPCFWQGPCPALARERDWCHDAAAPVAADRSRVDFSYLVLRRRAAGAPAAPNAYRVVSDRLDEKGRLRLFACGAAGRHPVVRLDKERTAENAALDGVERGEVITIEGGAMAGDGLRVGPATKVTRSPR